MPGIVNSPGRQAMHSSQSQSVQDCIQTFIEHPNC